MHFRDTQTGLGSFPFVPKSHSAILINAVGTYVFKDRQDVSFNVVVVANNIPIIVPISVSSHASGGAVGNVVYLA